MRLLCRAPCRKGGLERSDVPFCGRVKHCPFTYLDVVATGRVRMGSESNCTSGLAVRRVNVGGHYRGEEHAPEKGVWEHVGKGGRGCQAEEATS